MISHIFHCLEKEQHVSYLQFLQAVVKVEGQNMRKLQGLVMQEVCAVQGEIWTVLGDYPTLWVVLPLVVSTHRVDHAR